MHLNTEFQLLELHYTVAINMLYSKKPDNLLVKEILGPLKDLFVGVKHVRLLQRSLEKYFLLIVCFISGYCRDVQKDVLVVLAYV